MKSLASIKTRGNHKAASPHFVIKNDRSVMAWVLKHLFRYKAMSAEKAITRSFMLTRMGMAKFVKDKTGSLDVSLNLLRNAGLVSKHSDFGGGYYITKKGVETVMQMKKPKIRLTKGATLIRWFMSLLERNDALSVRKGLCRAEIIERIERSSMKKMLGSVNWLLDQSMNDKLIAKENKHGGRYFLTKNGLEKLKAVGE